MTKIKKSTGKLEQVTDQNNHTQDAYIHSIDPTSEVAVIYAKQVERANRGMQIESEIERLMAQRKLLVSELMTEKLRQSQLIDEMFDYEGGDECSKMITDPNDETKLVAVAIFREHLHENTQRKLRKLQEAAEEILEL